MFRDLLPRNKLLCQQAVITARSSLQTSMSVPSILGLKEVQMGAHVFKLYKVPLFARKPVNINVSRSVAPKIALVPASQYYCDVNTSNLNVLAKFH